VRPLPGPEIAIAGRMRPAFRSCGLTGVALAVPAGVLLAAGAGADAGVMAAVSVAACAAFLALALGTKVLGGEERLVYYHHQAAVLGVAALVPWALGEPVLRYLDAAAVGLGVFLACGRVGCLLAGCCHGRPGDRGVRYGPAHAEAGFPAHLVGVRLVPVQALEAGAVLAIAGAGTVLMLDGARPGAALALYLTAYAVLRFGLELLRGDPVRPYAAGLSAAQWISLAIAACVPAAGAAGLLPAGPAHAAAAVALAAASGALAATAARRRLLGARHVAELAAALDGPGVHETSLGIRISTGTTGGTRHYSLSARAGPLSDEAAADIARVIGRLRHGGPAPDVVRGGGGTVHLVSRPAAPGPCGTPRSA
jgi:hypothetical protein